MTITELVAKENIEKDNPFEGCEIKTELTLERISEIANSVSLILFNGETGAYRPLFKEFAIRLVIMRSILGIEMDEEYDLNDIYKTFMGVELYQKFLSVVATKLEYDFNVLLKTINEYIENEVYNTRKAIKDINKQIVDTLAALFSNEAFIKLLENVPVDVDEDDEVKD